MRTFSLVLLGLAVGAALLSRSPRPGAGRAGNAGVLGAGQLHPAHLPHLPHPHP